MTSIKSTFCLLLIVLAAMESLSVGLRCYDCSLIGGSGDASCKDNPTNLVEVNGTGSFEYCTKRSGTIYGREVIIRQAVIVPEKNPLGCHIDENPIYTDSVTCICDTEGCNKSNNNSDYPSGASSVILGTLPLLCAIAVYSLMT